MNKLEFKFWPPVVTSQYAICPIPFHLDTYKGCVYDCAYCFARDITNFHRRHKKGASFSKDLTANNPVAFKQWMIRNYAKVFDKAKPVQVALNMHLPIKIGAISDPCPPGEQKYRITEAFLRVFHLYDYPIQIQTKNPLIMAGILERLGSGYNICISVTLISLNKAWCRNVERKAPTPEARLKGIRRIVDLGYPVFVKVQPAVYPLILEQMPGLIAAIETSGAWGFNTEGLKVRISMPSYEQEIWRQSALGNVRQQYKQMGVRESSDYVLPDNLKLEYIELAIDLAEKYGLKYFSADNSPLGYGSGDECCGTEKLRNYSIFDYNLRSRAFGRFDPENKLAQCLKNFGRSVSGKKDFITIKEDIDKEL